MATDDQTNPLPATAAQVRAGRVPGANPPLKAGTLLGGAAVALTMLVVSVLALVPRPGRLDESSYADQRNGLLADGPTVSASLAGVAFGEHVTALLFVRGLPSGGQVAGWHAALPHGVRAWVVVQGLPGRQATPGQLPPTVGGLPVVGDPAQVLGRAVGLPRPNDHGAGVGYAVIDRHRQVRYRTLDPSWPSNGFEAGTISGAL